MVTIKSCGCCLPGARWRDQAAAVVFAFDHGWSRPGLIRCRRYRWSPRREPTPAAGLGWAAWLWQIDQLLTASAPITALSVVGLAGESAHWTRAGPAAPAWQGPSGLLDNIGRAVTRQVVRS